MADFTALKTAIQNAIKQNGNEEITGNILQDVLLAIVSTLGDGSINDLITALGSEATTRGNADATLQQNINAEAQARQLADSTLQGGINTVSAAITAINNAIGNGCVYAGIATPSSTPASGKVFYLALTAGTYTNYGGLEVPQGINILKYNGSAWSLDSFLGLDDAPIQGSSNLVKSGGVLDSIIKDGSAFDLSAYNGGTTYTDLSAALTALNSLPAAYKKGGMSFKFVLTSDNKYVQYRLMAQNFTTDVTQWQGVDDEPTANSKNLVESGGVYPTFASVRSLNSFAFTDNTSLNAIISNCRVLIKNSNIATLGIRLAKAADNYFRFYTYAADGTETLKIQQSYTNYYDAANKLFVYSDADIEVYLNFDVSAISDTLNGKFTTAAYISDNYFDTYPNDRYVKINDVDPTSGKQLSKLMTVRSAVLGIILYEQCHQINLYNGFNSVYGIRVYSSASEFEMFTFPEGLVGIVQLGTKGYIYIDTTKLTSGEMYIFVPINTTVFDNPFLESKLHHIFYCGHNRELSTLKAGIEEATKYMDSILYVDEGVYNLVEEFGSDYFENAVAGKTYGLFLKNRIHVIFSANSKVVSHYQGNNQYALSLYSPINAGEYGFTIENMNLECSRCRYAIHDERNGATEQYQSIYKNCHIKFDNSILNPSWDSQAVFGGGFGSNATVIIDSCILEFTENKNRLGYYHESNDNSNPNHAFKFIMKNCYLINGSFGISIARTDATKLSYITITNNCFPSEPGADNEGFAAYLFSVSESEGHYKYIAWNNKVRA